MKLIITESQYNRIISENTIDENILGSILRRLPRAAKSVARRPGLFINKQTFNSLYREIYRVIPKEMLTNKVEVREIISRLGALGKDLDTLKVNYIKKYGQQQYDLILKKYLYGQIDNKKFIETLRNVKNPNIRLKPVIGAGADHEIYQSVLYPDKLFKVERVAGEIDKWLPMFQSHTDLFPKTFKRTKIKSPDGKILSSVVIEKLDIAPFQRLWDDMEKLLYQSQKDVQPAYRSGLEHVSKNINKSATYKKQWNDFVLYSRKQSPQISKKIDEFYNLVNKLYKITPNPDIRKFNLGYDKNGILKALDI
jgi:hypothetical protein